MSNKIRRYKVLPGADAIGMVPMLQVFEGELIPMDDGRSMIKDAKGVIILITSQYSTIHDINTPIQ